ncbi:MAG: hypothetical protein O6939_07840, partial [Bacteroidetes bacterium]|nr:hypothetical protein [Bacteroidota bacterium]
LVTLTGNQCQTTIPYKFLNKNPFQSTYFAVQSMAAEASTAALAMGKCRNVNRKKLIGRSSLDAKTS